MRESEENYEKCSQKEKKNIWENKNEMKRKKNKVKKDSLKWLKTKQLNFLKY